VLLEMALFDRSYMTYYLSCTVLSYLVLNNIVTLKSDKLVEKIVKHDSWPIQPDIFNPPLLRLTSRKPLWLDLQPVMLCMLFVLIFIVFMYYFTCISFAIRPSSRKSAIN